MRDSWVASKLRAKTWQEREISSLEGEEERMGDSL